MSNRYNADSFSKHFELESIPTNVVTLSAPDDDRRKCKCKCECECFCCPECPEKPALTSTALSAFNDLAPLISVRREGTPIPLPKVSYDEGFIREGDERFRVKHTGFYFITYKIRTLLPVEVNTAVTLNGKIIESTNLIELSNRCFFAASTIAELREGDVLELIFYGADRLIRLSEGVGASLTVIRIA